MLPTTTTLSDAGKEAGAVVVDGRSDPAGLLPSMLMVIATDVDSVSEVDIGGLGDSPGQLVTSGAQLVMVSVLVMRTVDVPGG